MGYHRDNCQRKARLGERAARRLAQQAIADEIRGLDHA